MQLMDYRAWIAGLPGHPTQTEAGDAAGLDRSTVSRQLKRGALSMEVVAAIARAHGVKPADALVQTGHLHPEDIVGVGIEEALRQATNRQILREIERRSDPDATYLFGKTPGVINPRRTGDVIGFPSNGQGHPHPAEEEDGTVREWEEKPHAADSSPDEDSLREEAGADPID